MPVSLSRRLAPLWVFFAFALPATFGGEPSAALLGLVGDDVGVCVELSQLEAEVPAIVRSSLAERIKSLQLYRDWRASDDFKKLVRSREAIEQAAGKPFEELSYELVGKSVVVAVYPSPGGSLDAVLLTETAGDKTIDWLLETWNRQRAYTTDALDHRGQTYYRRSRTKPRQRALETLYYLRLGPIFAVSDKESMIRRVIELNTAGQGAAPATADSPAKLTQNLYQSKLYQRSQQDLSKDCVARVFFNPRACDASHKLFAATDNNPLRRLLADYWKRCEIIGLGLRFDDGLVVEVNAELDATVEQPAQAASGSPDVLRRIPKNAALAVSGRIDARAIAQLLAEFAPENERAAWSGLRQIARGLLLGRDPLDDVLPVLGPNWIACLVPRKAGGHETDFPADGLIAFELSPDNEPQSADGKPSLRDALDNALNTGVNYLAAVHNGKSPAKSAVVKSTEEGSSMTRWIENMGEFEPAYALTPNAIAIASSRQLAGEFAAANGPGEFADSPLFRQVQTQYLHNENQLLLVDFAALRNMMSEHRPFFLRRAGGPDSAADSDGEKELARVDDVLRIFDVAFLAARVDGQRVRLVAGSVLSDKPAQP